MDIEPGASLWLAVTVAAEGVAVMRMLDGEPGGMVKEGRRLLLNSATVVDAAAANSSAGWRLPVALTRMLTTVGSVTLPALLDAASPPIGATAAATAGGGSGRLDENESSVASAVSPSDDDDNNDDDDDDDDDGRRPADSACGFECHHSKVMPVCV